MTLRHFQEEEPDHPGKKWQLHQAKAQFSHLIEVVQRDGLQIITKNGEDVAIIMSKEQFQKYSQPEESLIDFFRRAPYPEIDLDTTRDKGLPRDIEL